MPAPFVLTGSGTAPTTAGGCMDLYALRAYVRDQGDIADDEDFTDPQLNQVINIANAYINSLQDWPYLEAVDDLTLTDGVADLPADYGQIRSPARYVASTSNIYPLDHYNVDEAPVNPLTSGNPRGFWIEAGEVHVWPVSSGDVRLRYYKVAPDLTDDAHEPIFDCRFHYLVGKHALVHIYQRLDILDAAQQVRAEFDEGVARMDLFYLRARDTGIYGGGGRRRSSRNTEPFPFEV